MPSANGRSDMAEAEVLVDQVAEVLRSQHRVLVRMLHSAGCEDVRRRADN